MHDENPRLEIDDEEQYENVQYGNDNIESVNRADPWQRSHCDHDTSLNDSFLVPSFQPSNIPTSRARTIALTTQKYNKLKINLIHAQLIDIELLEELQTTKKGSREPKEEKDIYIYENSVRNGTKVLSQLIVQNNAISASAKTMSSGDAFTSWAFKGHYSTKSCPFDRCIPLQHHFNCSTIDIWVLSCWKAFGCRHGI